MRNLAIKCLILTPDSDHELGLEFSFSQQLSSSKTFIYKVPMYYSSLFPDSWSLVRSPNLIVGLTRLTGHSCSVFGDLRSE